MLGSSAGAGPGAQGLPGGRRNGGPAEATRTTDLDRAMIVRANVPGSGSGWRGAHSVWGGPCVGPRAHTKWASQVRPLLGPQGDLVTRAVSRAQGRSALEACARLPTGPLRARGPSLAAAGRARPAYIGRGVCVWHRWAMPTYLASVEADGHVRVAASVPVDGARLSGADKGARAPANWSPLAPPVSVWVSLASVHGARPCLPAAGLPKGLPPTGHPAARPRGAPRRANSASQLAAARSPARLPLLLLLALLALLALPSSPSRARLSARLEGARLPGPQPPSTDSPQPGPSRAPPAGGGPPAPADRAPPAAAARGSPRPSRPANWRESMEVEIPRGPAVTGAPPRLRRKVSGPPSKRPALPGPLMGGQQGYLTAYTTRLVTSVVCRGFIPARGDIAIRQPAPGGFSPGAVASLLRYMARRPIRIQLRRAGLHRRVPARILT
ncbi:hypothetical protein KXV82_006662 [Aspergillus fumigatus]|nr:hypothetical protein KXV82_006662 [Aspergillus fumigatus]